MEGAQEAGERRVGEWQIPPAHCSVPAVCQLCASCVPAVCQLYASGVPSLYQRYASCMPAICQLCASCVDPHYLHYVAFRGVTCHNEASIIWRP